jgi:hypothetical protein
VRKALGRAGLREVGLYVHGRPVPVEEPVDHTHLLGLGEPGVLEDALGFLVSDEHFVLRQRLGLGLRLET